MKIRSLLLGIALLFCAPFVLATPAIVQVVQFTTSSSGITTTPGDNLIVILAASGGVSGTFTSISYDGSTTAFTTDDSFKEVNDGGDGKTYYTGAWSIASVTGASHTVAFSTTNVTNVRGWLIEVSGTGVFDVVATGKFGDSASPVSNSVTPTVANDLLLAAYIALSGTSTYSVLTNSFVSQSSGTGQMLAALVDSATTAITSGATLSASGFWEVYLIGYKSSGGGASCANPGITQAGSFVVPTAGSTVVRLKNGSFGTVDCATDPYKQKSGVFGVN